MSDSNGGKYEETKRPTQRPKRYNNADKQPAAKRGYQFSPGTKSSQAMIRGTECWNCTRSLPEIGKGIGPRYCMECLQKKYKSVRRGMALVNKLVVAKKKRKTKAAAFTSPDWIKKDR